jgi:hypothetical protein
MAGRFVSVARAAEGSHFGQLHPEQRFVNSAGLAALVLLLALYALCGWVFGVLPVFVLDGFLPLQGVPAVAGAVGSAALAFAWGTHLAQRHWSGASAKACEGMRQAAYWISGAGWALAAVSVVVVIVADLHFLARPLGLAPKAEWMLAPLPWVWPRAVVFARDAFVVRLIVAGAIFVVLFLLFHKLAWTRCKMVFLGLVLWTAGLYFIGDGAYLYAAARALGGLRLPPLEQALQADPGLHNAWTWLAWWGGWTSVAFGTLVLAGALFLPRSTLSHM